MSNDLTGRRPHLLAVTRYASAGAALLLAAALSACTTTEGTNAFSSFYTFQEEVLDSTAEGVGLIPREVKPDPTNRRAPLVLPKDESVLPPPEEAATLPLPEDSTKVKVDTTGMTAEDLSRLRNARVVDLTTLGGRPLTEAEARKLTARMKAFRASKARSIFLPPVEYYQTVKNAADLVCLAPNGDLVAVNDPLCPPEIQKALLKQ
jgi:hypothetical protein